MPTLFVSNGTIAILPAIKALGLNGKIITTPFDCVATSSSIVWEGFDPVCLDVEEHGANIDPKKIEAAVIPGITGIIATHCFGVLCDVNDIQTIAGKHGSPETLQMCSFLRNLFEPRHPFVSNPFYENSQS